jgi:hypothetical protein
MVVEPTGIVFPGFGVDYVLLSIFTITTDGTPLVVPFQLIFGSTSMPVLILDPSGNPAPNVNVTAKATVYSDVTESCTTDITGVCALPNLATTTISLFAITPDNYFAADGLAATAAQVTMQLIPLHQPASGASFNVSNGTTVWTGGTVVDQAFKLKVKRDSTLVVGTNGQYDLQTASSAFNVYPFTTTAFIKYKFVTAEVPGGYFG